MLLLLFMPSLAGFGPLPLPLPILLVRVVAAGVRVELEKQNEHLHERLCVPQKNLFEAEHVNLDAKACEGGRNVLPQRLPAEASLWVEQRLNSRVCRRVGRKRRDVTHFIRIVTAFRLGFCCTVAWRRYLPCVYLDWADPGPIFPAAAPTKVTCAGACPATAR